MTNLSRFQTEDGIELVIDTTTGDVAYPGFAWEGLKKIPKVAIKCVYKLFIPGGSKFYIGSSSNLQKRITRHKLDLLKDKHPNRHLQNSFNKHGKVFIVEILEEVSNEADLDTREQYYIDTFGFHNLINKCPVAYSTRGRKASAETIEKIRENSKNNISSKFVNYWLGKKRSTEQREKQSLRQLGRTMPEATKEKIGVASAQWKRSDEHIAALNNAWRGSKHSEEAKAKIRAKNTGRVFSEETKQKMRENHHKSRGVVQIDKITMEVVRTYASASEAARLMSVGLSGIGNCCRGDTKTSHGFIWKFVDEL
jgi:group I intron endonuclease